MSSTATVPLWRMETAAPHRLLDGDSREWLRSLRASGRAHEAAVARLHALLLRAARFEVARRRPTLPHLRGNELEEIALEAAEIGRASCRERRENWGVDVCSQDGEDGCRPRTHG